MTNQFFEERLFSLPQNGVGLLHFKHGRDHVDLVHPRQFMDEKLEPAEGEVNPPEFTELNLS